MTVALDPEVKIVMHGEVDVPASLHMEQQQALEGVATATVVAAVVALPALLHRQQQMWPQCLWQEQQATAAAVGNVAAALEAVRCMVGLTIQRRCTCSSRGSRDTTSGAAMTTQATAAREAAATAAGAAVVAAATAAIPAVTDEAAVGATERKKERTMPLGVELRKDAVRR